MLKKKTQTLISEANRKKTSISYGAYSLDSGAMEKAHVSDESRYILHPSCLMPTKTKGTVVIWGCFSWLGLDSATLCAQKIRSAHYLNTLNDQVFS